MNFETLFDSIGLEEEGRESFWRLHARQEEPEFAAAVAEGFRVYPEGDPAFGAFLEGFAAREQLPPEILNLYFYLLLAAGTHEKYMEMGISPEVFSNTLEEISVYCKRNRKEKGVYGIPQRIYRRWLRRHLGCEIFRIGFLWFQVAPSIYDTQIGGITVSKGDRILSVHVSGGQPLEEAVCEASYSAARIFFKKHFAMETPVFFCYSWLLQPWLAEVLPESSRICVFQSKYKIIDFADDPGDMLLWVFPKICENIEDYPEDTTLRRLTKERLRRGGIIGYGSGARL